MRVIEDSGFARISELNREALERWLGNETRADRSARSRNAHRAAMIAFCNWCADPTIGRMISNPFRGVPKADEKADPRRRRRSMTETELTRLLEVAHRRPMAEALTVRRGKRKGEQYADLRPETRQRLDLLGMERALTNWCRLVFPFQDWVFCPWRGSGRLRCLGPCNSRAGRRRMYAVDRSIRNSWLYRDRVWRWQDLVRIDHR